MHFSFIGKAQFRRATLFCDIFYLFTIDDFNWLIKKAIINKFIFVDCMCVLYNNSYVLLELFHERCSLDKWACSLDKWYRQASHTQFTCDVLFVFESAVDLRMKTALHTFISIKDVC